MGDYFDTKGDGTHSFDTGDERLTVREACRRRMPLGGVDAEALEHGMTQLEEEKRKLQKLYDDLVFKVQMIKTQHPEGCAEVGLMFKKQMEKANAEILELRAALKQAEDSDAESLRLYRSARLRADKAGGLVERYRDALDHIIELRPEFIENAKDIAKKAITEIPPGNS